MIKECFSPLPIFPAKLFDQEVIGKELLKRIAKQVYGKKDPAQFFFTQKPINIKKTEAGYDLSLILPFVERKDLDLCKNGEELIITVGNYKRNILLPPILSNYSIENAKIEQEKLKIAFRQ